MTTEIYIDGTKLDLYKDENISVEASVLDIKDITKNTTAFTRSFTVPASLNNNQTFVHYYNSNIDNSFDARTKIDSEIHLDGIPFKKGKMRLLKVQVKKGVPDSYTINFNGNLVTLKDKVKKDELSDLDLSAFDHTYDSANVKTGLTSSLFSGDIIYNLFVKKQYYINADATDNTQGETLANISYYGGADTGVLWNDLRPSIKLINIIEAIETDYNITFTRQFFGTAEFDGLYLWLNPDSEVQLGGDTVTVDFDGGGNTWMNHTTDIGSYTVNNAATTARRYFDMDMTVVPSSGYTGVEYTILMYRDGEVFAETTHTGTATQVTRIEAPTEATVTYSVYYQIRTNEEFAFTSSLFQDQRRNLLVSISSETTTSTADTITSNFSLARNLPKVKILDFLKGLFNMFKLVVVPQDNGDLYVNTLDAYYDEGSLYDVTEYINFDSYDVERGEILNEIGMKFQEPSTILNIQFEKNTGIPYGDEELILEDDTGELLDGESLTFELPFEQIVYERLPDLNDNVLSNTMYGAIVDESVEPSNPKAHIFYNINNSVGPKTIGFQNDVGTKEALSGNINIPSHTEVLTNPSYSTVFGPEVHEYTGNVITNTLYSNHYQDYIEAIFNIKKRTSRFKAVLPLNIIYKLELNDVLKIDNNYYRIDKYSYNVLTSETNLTLVNSFNNNLARLTPSSLSIYTDYTAKTETMYISNLSGATITEVDTGFGVGFTSVTTSGNILEIAFTESSEDTERDVFINIVQGTQEINIYVNQQSLEYFPKLDFSRADNSQYLNSILIGLS